MRWHKEHITEEGVMRHCSDSLAWKHFDHIHPDLQVIVVMLDWDFVQMDFSRLAKQGNSTLHGQ